MSRIIYYANSLVTSKQLSQSQIFATEELGMFMQAIIGTSIGAYGLPCTPSTGLSVDIGSGAIFSQAPIDVTSIGSFPANSNTVVKIATHFSPANITLDSPTTMGHSVNYLIEGNFLEKDVDPEVIEYFNPSNPHEPIFGIGADHRPQYTIRRTSVSLNAVVGVPAVTGTQLIPEPTSGWVPLWVVTISAGQSSINQSNISMAPNANFIEGIYDKFASLGNSISNAYAYITHVNNVVVTSNSATATQINDLFSKFENSTAQIYQLNQTFANTNTAVATQINELSSKIDNSTATIYQLAQTVVDQHSATATEINHLSSQLLNNLSQSDLFQINQTIATEHDATALQINTLNARFDGTDASIYQLNQVTANTNAALATQVDILTSKIAGANATISQLAQTVATPNSAVAIELNNLSSRINGANATITEFKQTEASNNAALANSIYSLNANVGTTNARISTLENAVATNNSAQADSISSLNATVGNLSASVTTLQSASANGGFSTAAYGLTVQAGNIITGIQAISNSAGTSEFNILASSFSVSDPNSSAKYHPLTYKNGTLTIGNCVVDGDLIVNGTVTTKTIANGAVSQTVIATASAPVVYNFLTAILNFNITLLYAAEIVCQGYVYGNDGGGHGSASHNTTVQININPGENNVVNSNILSQNIVRSAPWAVDQALFTTGSMTLEPGTYTVSLWGSTANSDTLTQRFLLAQWFYK